MSLWKIAWRSIQQRALASTLTAISMALGVTLVVAVLVIHGVVGESFRNNAGLGYNMIVGAKGGKLQLVLNTVYYLSTPVENIPYSYYKEFTEGGKFKAFGVDKAIPVCLGDYYQQFRVIGTTPEMFTDLDYGNGKKYKFASGRNFETKNFFEGVIGATVARECGLAVGSQFAPSHGASDGALHEPFTVVGILAPTGTPNDRGLFINIEGFYLLENHAKPLPASEQAKEHADDEQEHADGEKADGEHADSTAGSAEHGHDEHGDSEHGHSHPHHHSHKPLPEAQREVTAVLVRTSNDIFVIGLRNTINEGGDAQAVLPILEITNLFKSIVDPLQWVLLGLTILIVIVSGIGILVSIYNSMSDRRHEIAVMRALGARRRTVMSIVLWESILLSLGGGVLGWFIGHTLVAVLSPRIAAETGVTVGFLQLLTFQWSIMNGRFILAVPYELLIISGLIMLASIVGYLPAMAAYRTDVAKALSSTP